MDVTQPDPRRWKALAILCIAAFMVICDAQIVILALPSIEKELGFEPGGAQWTLSAYLLSFGGLLLLGGRTADLLGRRRMFMIGTSLFLVSSLLCGLAWSGGVLIGARVVQGMSAAIMAPTALSILMTTFPEGAERNKALGIWSSVGGVGGTAALLIGGPVTDLLGWEWIFFLNLPIAGILLALSPVLLRESTARTGRVALDPVGALTITAALVMLVYAVVEAPRAGWASPQTLGLLFGAAVMVALFVVVESRSSAPMVPLRIFRSRPLVVGNLLMLTVGAVAFGMSLVVSLYAQQVLGFSALVFGLGTAVMTATTVVGSIGGQAIVTRTGPIPVLMGGLFLMGAGSLLLAQVSADGSYFGDLFFGLLVFGPGLGSGAVAASIAALTGVQDQDSGLASGINNAAFQIGGGFGIAVLSTVSVAWIGPGGDAAGLTAGFQAGFYGAVGFAVLGLLVAVLLGVGRRAKLPVMAGNDRD